MKNKILTGLIVATTLTTTFSATTPVSAGVSGANNPNIVVTVEAPSVEESTLFTNKNSGATKVYEDTFDSSSETPGIYANGLAFAGNPNIGTYTTPDLNSADQYGGAGGTGNYFDVDKKISGGLTSSTLTLNKSQRYFGLWWSAGDQYNRLSFYSGDSLVESFSTADVINFIAEQPNANNYYGNPDGAFKGQDSNEPFAFLNFFADPKNKNVTFDKIVFTNSGNTGFESDNHTIATDYQSISGTIISAPEPSSMLGIFLTSIVGVSSILTGRMKNRKWGVAE